jgi:hypothetical protein
MKTSKAYFERFKKEFLFWQQKLGLTQYRESFKHKKLDREFAKLYTQQLDKIFVAYLNTDIAKDLDPPDDGPEAHARHEVLHLLLSRLVWLGSCRYIEQTDLDEEAEAIVVRLEKVLK